MQKHQLAIITIERNQPAPKLAGMLKYHSVCRAGHIFGYCDNIETGYPQCFDCGRGKVLVDQ